MIEGVDLKILHIIDKFFPIYLGTSVRTYNLLSRLKSKAILVTQEKKFEGNIIKEKTENFGNIHVKRVALIAQNPKNLNKNLPFRYYYAIKNYKLNKQILIQKCNLEKFDIVHAHDLDYFASSALEISKIRRKPLILEMHIPTLSNIKLRLYETFILNMSHYMDYCNKIVVLTRNFKNYVSNNYHVNPKDVVVVPNGVDLDHFKKETDKRKILSLKNSLKLNSKVVMYAGYMDDINGINYILDVIPTVLKENPDLSFLFVGYGPQKDNVISISKKFSQIKYIPMVEYDKMPLYYQLCDLFVLPRPSTISAELLTPLKLLEAMAMERKVLGSNVGGITEVINHGKNGYLFEKGDIDDFKDKIIEVLNIDNDRTCENARKILAKKYNWDHSSHILHKIYENLTV